MKVEPSKRSMLPFHTKESKIMSLPSYPLMYNRNWVVGFWINDEGEPQLRMNWLSLRNNWLKFKTSEESPIVLVNKDQKMSTCNCMDLETLGSWLIMHTSHPSNVKPWASISLWPMHLRSHVLDYHTWKAGSALLCQIINKSSIHGKS